MKGRQIYDQRSLAAVKRLLHTKKITVKDVQRNARVYRKLAMQLHPDRGGSTEQFKVLSNIHSNRSGKWDDWNSQQQVPKWGIVALVFLLLACIAIVEKAIVKSRTT
ncbi:hypothetical protein T492DRAFT_844626 [Pavlovales sp. CCMP2436]|nr:hypothetical protein T492DRAFT_844626 [Pavlovales sp. CCMP2436]